jgi:hypothetical protein
MHEIGITNTQPFVHQNDIGIDTHYPSEPLLNLIWQRAPAGSYELKRLSA